MPANVPAGPRSRRAGGGAGHLRRTLGDLEAGAVRTLDLGLGALMHGIEGDELGLVIGGQGLGIGQAVHDGVVNGVAVFFLRGQRAGENQFPGVLGGEERGLAQRQLVLRQRAGLVGTEHVHAGHLLDGFQPGDDGLHAR
jgi:hypothetical protein